MYSCGVQSKWVRNSRKMNNLVLLAGHVLCYAFGTLWFSIVKENAGSPIGFPSRQIQL